MPHRLSKATKLCDQLKPILSKSLSKPWAGEAPCPLLELPQIHFDRIR
jgi:hypothetical protein